VPGLRLKRAAQTVATVVQAVTLLKPTCNYTYPKVRHSKILHCDHMEFVCFRMDMGTNSKFCLTGY